MNIQRRTTKIMAILSLSTLVMVGLEGCNGIQSSVVESEPVETEVAEVNFEEMDLVESSTAQVEIEPTPIPEILTYTNETYGFTFNYPETWALTEEDHGVLLQRGTNQLRINFRWSEEDVPDFGPTGLGAGDLLFRDKISFLDQIIPAEFLSYEGKVKAVLYGKTGYVEIDNRVFLIMLEDLKTGYLVVDLAEETINEAKAILETFLWIAGVNRSIEIGNQSIKQQDREDGSSYWVTLEDPQYGVRFAIPCFWSVDFPKEYHGGIGAYPIRNYTEEYAMSFGKREDGVWARVG